MIREITLTERTTRHRKIRVRAGSDMEAQQIVRELLHGKTAPTALLEEMGPWYGEMTDRDASDSKRLIKEVTSRWKEPYGMYAADWYVTGIDLDGNEVEGWESDFIHEEN